VAQALKTIAMYPFIPEPEMITEPEMPEIGGASLQNQTESISVVTSQVRNFH